MSVNTLFLIQKVLVIDDMDLSRLIKELESKLPFDFKIIQSEPCTSVKQALDMVKDKNPNVILLDLHLTEAKEFEGFRIAKALNEQGNKTLILSLSNWDKKGQRQGYGDLVKHFPGRNAERIVKCFEGKCDCEKEPSTSLVFKKLTRDSHLVIATSDPEFNSSLVDRLKDIFPNVVGVKRGEELAEMIIENDPETVDAVLVEGIKGVGNLTHGYGHIQNAPQFDSLNLQIIIISFEDEKKEAKDRGYKFIKIPCDTERFKELIDEEV